MILALLLAASVAVSAPSRQLTQEQVDAASATMRCIAFKNRAKTMRFLEARFGTQRSRDAGSSMLVTAKSCWPTKDFRAVVGAREGVLRFGLYDALYSVDFPIAPIGGFAALPPLYPKVLGEQSGDPNVTVSLLRAADCTIRSAPREAHALALTKAFSPGEAAAFAGLQAALGPCLPASGDIRLPKALLRGAIVQSLYQLRQASNRLARKPPDA